MDGSFNGQILVDKLSKLNNSQQSIETLSHWCIFHRRKAKQVVETWERQFFSSRRDRRISFLYLANDILQNSRRKGLEFVTEFWKVLPDTLKDVMENGDEFGRNAASRMMDIWDERKVFGSHGQTLKEKLLGKKSDSQNRKMKKSPSVDVLAKLISGCERVYSEQFDEEALLSKCQAAMSVIDDIEKEVGGDVELGRSESRLSELQEKHEILEDCIKQVKVADSSRSTLLSLLKEAVNIQEFELDRIRNLLQVAQLRCEKAGDLSRRFLSSNCGHKDPSDASPGAPPIGYIPDPLAPPQGSQEPIVKGTSETDEQQRNTDTAAAVVAKLAASPSSTQMLSFVLSSLASEGVIGPSENESSDAKRPKHENNISPYSPSQFPAPQTPHLPPPMLPTAMSHLLPALPPLNTTSSAQLPFGYGFVHSPSPVPPSGFPVLGMPLYMGPPNPCIGLHTTDGLPSQTASAQPPPPPAVLTQPPISRQ